MRQKSFLFFSVFALILSSCNSTPSSSTDIIIDGVTFIKSKMTAHLRAESEVEEVDAYFRMDGLKNIPYLKLSDFYKCHLGKPLRNITQSSKGVFTVTSASGGVAEFDTVKDTLKSQDLEQFINTTIYRQEGASNVYYDGSPFLRIKETTTDVAATPKDIALKQSYNIDLFAYENDVLMPITTACNLFQGPTMLTAFYTLKDIYFVDPNDEKYETNKVVSEPKFNEGLNSFFSEGKRSQEQADFSYGELCFFIDNYYGCPGRETLHDKLNELNSLDAALASKDNITRQARTWLKSTDQVEYYAGLFILSDYLADTGHTMLDYGLLTYLENNQKLFSAVDEKISSVGYTLKENAAKRVGKDDPTYEEAYSNERKEKDINNLGTKIEGDTLLFTFDQFIYDVEGWNNYYSGNSKELPSDPIGAFKEILEQYKDGQTIKNIVIDLTINGGGSGDVVFMLMAMMGKGAYLNFYDFLNKNKVHVDYEADLNFDGKFDELDKQVTYPYNFGILTSAYSFSCGNLLPVQAKESGIMILGDKSGGGACAVIDGVVAEGYYARSASQVRLEAKDGSNVDFGVEPHQYLYQKTEAGHDVSKVYDLSLIKQYMDSFYQK